MNGKYNIRDGQSARLAALIEKIVYCFGTHALEGDCGGNISHAEFRALRAALHRDNCTMQEVAKSAVVTKSGATRIVGRLAEKGLVRRMQDPKDGRICCVALTKEGKMVLTGIEEQLKSDLASILAEMEPGMQEVLAIGLNAFWTIAQQRVPSRGKQVAGEHARGKRKIC